MSSCDSIVEGRHLRMLDNLNVTLLEAVNSGIPKGGVIQTFLAPSDRLFLSEMSEVDRKICRGIIRKYKLNWFVHSPYMVNLCTLLQSDKLTARRCAEEYLSRAFNLEALGVVFHVGKHVKLSAGDGLCRMTESLRYLASKAQSGCPVLLETPAGQGTELLVGYTAFSNYYNRLKPLVGTHVKVCIDTCHVFAGGDDPLEYITKWVTDHGADSIGVVHFNDSKTPKGSRKDRHEHYLSGKGHIGLDTMTKIAVFCSEHGIGMVIE